MSLKAKLEKAVFVALTGGVLSVIVLGGMQPVPMMGGMWAPKALVHAGVLGVSSVAASWIVPKVTPYISVGSPQLQRFDRLVLEPAVLGLAFLAVESIVAPAAEVQGGSGTFREIAAGAVASVAASYLSEGLGITESVLA